METAGILLPSDFFEMPATELAPLILGKILVRTLPDGNSIQVPITEVEVYYGMEDKACHASKGMTPRNRIMFGRGGYIYMYLIYGMYWMFNIVTGPEGHPEALLVRGTGSVKGPGRVTRHLQMDQSFYGESLVDSNRIHLLEAPPVADFITAPRVGIEYAGEPWVSMPWRFMCR